MITVGLSLVPLNEWCNSGIVVSIGRFDVRSHRDQTAFKIPYSDLLIATSLFEVLDVTSRSGASRDSVRSLAFCVVL
jgi:hypothetical protein